MSCAQLVGPTSMAQTLRAWSLLAVVTAGLGGCGAAGDERISANRHGVALGGYDVVTYYQGEAAARVGLPEHRFDYQQVTFFFISAVNRERFARQPDVFLPQYGGYCALSMALGMRVDSDPDAYTVTDGKLYLTSSSALKLLWRWFGDVEAADANWLAMLEE